MHRSGTSLVSRLANFLGVYLGPPERMLQPRPDNPSGYWEHQVINGINDQILARFGGSYFDPPDFPIDWQESPKLQDLREQASELFAQEFANQPSWGWKDPRTCLTLPFWQRQLPEMQYVICVRNPADVALSLHKRDGLPFGRSVALWLVHMNAVLQGTRGHRRTILFYEDFMLDWSKQLNLLAQFVNGSTDCLTEEIQARAAVFVDQELHHHSTPLAENLSHPEISIEAKALYLLLREAKPDAEQQTSGAASSILETFAEQAASETRRSKRLDAQIEQLRANRQQLEAQYEHLKVVHEQLDVHRHKVERQLMAEQGRARGLAVVRAQLEKELSEKLVLLSDARRACDALEGKVQPLRERAEKLAGERDNATAMINELRRQLDDVESSLAWKAVSKARATKDFLIPLGTRRRHLYDLGLGILKNGRLPRIRN